MPRSQHKAAEGQENEPEGYRHRCKISFDTESHQETATHNMRDNQNGANNNRRKECTAQDEDWVVVISPRVPPSRSMLY